MFRVSDNLIFGNGTQKAKLLAYQMQKGATACCYTPGQQSNYVVLTTVVGI
tara:strand:+ start:205 stop:357 length:153 start_codon:yes stop_codon:yes gene_type:complete